MLKMAMKMAMKFLALTIEKGQHVADSRGVIDHPIMLPVPHSLHSRRRFMARISVFLNCSDSLPVELVRVLQLLLCQRCTTA